jgi:hypothetical protein
MVVAELNASIAATGLLRLPAFLEANSIEPFEFLFRNGGIPNLYMQANGWLSREFCFDLARKAAEATSDPMSGAKVGALPGRPQLQKPAAGGVKRKRDRGPRGRLCTIVRTGCIRPASTPMKVSGYSASQR